MAVSYRRERSFSRAFITIQSSSPRTNFDSFAGSTPRTAAMLGNSAVVESRVLGRCGSSSRTSRSTSSRAAARTRSFCKGVVPVSSSYRSTPSA